MDPKVKELMYATGADERLASLLVEFTGGDIDGAKKIIEAMPKDFVAIKVRYMAHKTHYYGSILLVVDVRRRTMEKVLILADKKITASQIDNKLRYEEFRDAIIKYIKENNPDDEMMGRLREGMEKEEFIESIFRRLRRDNSFDPEELKVVFSELFSRVLTEQNCAIKIETEGVDLFRIHRTDREYVIRRESEENLSKQEDSISKKEEVHIRNISLVLLKVEPVLSPVRGVPATELEIGDQILVKIIDEREIGEYLCELLKGKDESGERIPITALIKEINKQEETDNLSVIVQFGPGIAGKMIIPPEVKIETPFSIQEYADEYEKSSFSLSSINSLWLIFIVVIIFLILYIVTVFIGK